MRHQRAQAMEVCFFMVWGPEVREEAIRAGVWWGFSSWLVGICLCPLMTFLDRTCASASSYEDASPFCLWFTSWLQHNYLPKGPSSVTLEVRAPTDEFVSITIRLVMGSLMNNLSNVPLLLITFPPFVSMDPFWECGQAASMLTSKRKSMCLARY